jgi:hypothetical protein
MDGLPDAERMERLDAEAGRYYGERFRDLCSRRKEAVWKTCESNLRAEAERITTASIGPRIEVRLPSPRCCVEGCDAEATTYRMGVGRTVTWYCGQHAERKAKRGTE